MSTLAMLYFIKAVPEQEYMVKLLNSTLRQRSGIHTAPNLYVRSTFADDAAIPSTQKDPTTAISNWKND